ncbi:MAG: hypothetical protein F2894_06085 [Actinobacteria bacterium]|uniref:Unannotated protein n=1 Tax=freshwater metagenome TaxID=449393 RepID=A0A6J7QP30_9ZZZZ|nr:hypothetical protein [Actinomycetota bacterium]
MDKTVADKTVANKTPANKTLPDKSSRTFVLPVLLIASIAPLVAALINACVSDWAPYGDFAIINMRIRDVWSSSTPLTGLYSRPGWNHAGPMMFWVLSPFSALSGGSARWVLIGGVVIAGVFIATALFLAFRHSRSLFVFTALLWLLSLRALPSDVVFEYWNPWMPLPALILLLVLALRVSVGKTRDLIGIVIVGSFAVQTHIGTALIVVTISAFAFGSVAFDAYRERALPTGFRSIAGWVAGLSVLLWAAPFIGVLRGDPGNLGAVFKYFLAGSHPSVGIANALKIMANEFSPPFPWLGAGYRVEFLSGHALLSPVVWLLLPIGALCVGGFVAYKQVPDLGSRRNDLRAVVLATLLFVASIIAISSADEPRAYTFAWRAIVAALVVLASSTPLARLLLRRFPSTKVRWAFEATLSLLAVVLMLAPVMSQNRRLQDWSAEVKSTDALILSGAVSKQSVIRVEGTLLDNAFPSLIESVINSLDRHGFEVKVSNAQGRVYGVHHVASRRGVNEVWIVTENGSLTPGLLAQTNAKLVWSSTPLNSRDEARLAGLQAKITAQLNLLGKPEYAAWLDSEFGAFVLARDIPDLLRSDISELSRLLAKAGGQCRCAIVKIPGGKGYLG